jgi:hypothetical protein
MKKQLFLLPFLAVAIFNGCSTTKQPKPISQEEKILGNFAGVPIEEKEKIEDKIELSIYKGEVNNSPISEENFNISQGEVREICIMPSSKKPACFWITYQEDLLYFNITPNKKEKDNVSYIDKNYIKTHKMTINNPYIYSKYAENGIFDKVFFKSKKDFIDLKVFVKTSKK